MNRNRYWLGLVLLVIGVVFGVLMSGRLFTTPSAKAIRSLDAKNWEYKAIWGHREQVVNQSNQLGKEGWELVSVAPDENSVNQQHQHLTLYSAFLKRPL